MGGIFETKTFRVCVCVEVELFGFNCLQRLRPNQAIKPEGIGIDVWAWLCVPPTRGFTGQTYLFSNETNQPDEASKC